MADKGADILVVPSRRMNLFPIYIVGMLARAWLFSGEGKVSPYCSEDDVKPTNAPKIIFLNL